MVAQRQRLSAPSAMNPASLAALPPQARAQYFAGLPPDQAAAQQAALQNYIYQQNRDYMKKTVKKKAICKPTNGGNSSTFAISTQYTFNAPVATDAFLEGFLVKIDLKLDFAVGSSAVYAATRAAELALIKQITVLYQGTQFKFSPYILPQLRRMFGIYMPKWPDRVLGSANEVTSLTSYLNQGTLPVSGSAQVINLEFYVPLNLLHPQDVRGLLPIDGESTTAQIVVETCTSFVGNDAAQNPWYPVSGTGHAITLTAAQPETIQLIACYRDGVSMSQKDTLPISFDGLGTIQFQNDVNLTGLTADTTYRQKITKLEQHYYALLTVIDGQQATKYADVDNIIYMDLGTDETGTNLFWAYGLGTNMSVYEYFDEIRWLFRQDLDEGIIPIAYAPSYGEADPDNLNGSHILNCDPSRGGWSAIHYGIQLDSLASTLSGVTPRVECHLIWVNPRGLIATT